MIEIPGGNGEEEQLDENSEEYRIKVRTLNDVFRTTFLGGRVLITSGIQALGGETISQILDKVQKFKSFKKGNDPYGEHDFGTFQHNGETINWKIECYDKEAFQKGEEYLSPDSSDSKKTLRVMIIMLAEEY